MHTTHLTQAFACPDWIHYSSVQRKVSVLPQATVAVKLVVQHAHSQSHVQALCTAIPHSSILAGIGTALSTTSGCRARCSTCTQLPKYRRQRPSQIHYNSAQQRYRASCDGGCRARCSSMHSSRYRHWLVHCRFTAARCSTVSVLHHQHSGCSARCSSMHRLSPRALTCTADSLLSVQRVSVLHHATSGCSARCSSMRTTQSTCRRWLWLQIHTTARCSGVPVLHHATVAVELFVPTCTQLSLTRALACALQIHCISVKHGIGLPQATVSSLFQHAHNSISHGRWLVTADSLQVGAARYQCCLIRQLAVKLGVQHALAVHVRALAPPSQIHYSSGSTVSVLHRTWCEARCSSMHTSSHRGIGIPADSLSVQHGIGAASCHSG
jgi:hypothetical protein